MNIQVIVRNKNNIYNNKQFEESRKTNFQILSITSHFHVCQSSRCVVRKSVIFITRPCEVEGITLHGRIVVSLHEDLHNLVNYP